MGHTIRKERYLERGRDVERKKRGRKKKKLFISCLSAHSNSFSLLHNQAAHTGSSEIAAYVTGPALDITDGISLLQNTTHLLLDTYTAKQRTIYLFIYLF